MPRNGSGTYTVPVTFTPNTLADANEVNTNFTDAGSAITGSLARDGQAGMTGQFKATSGTVALPSIAFDVDTDTGFYRIGANQLGISAGGVNVGTFTSTGLTLPFPLVLPGNPSSNLQASTKQYVDAQVANAVSNLSSDILASINNVFVGFINDFGGGTLPAGWLLCSGQAVSRTTFATLFARVGTTYGVGDGSTTFNVPDRRGRGSVGKDDMGGVAANRITNSGTGNPGIAGNTLGAAGGVDRYTITTPQTPAHTHGAGTLTARGLNTTNGSASSVATTANSSVGADYTILIAGDTASTGGGEAHPNVHPVMVHNVAIFAGV